VILPRLGTVASRGGETRIRKFRSHSEESRFPGELGGGVKGREESGIRCAGGRRGKSQFTMGGTGSAFHFGEVKSGSLVVCTRLNITAVTDRARILRSGNEGKQKGSGILGT